MKVLVTGAAGFLGKALIERLLAHNFDDIRCNVRRPADIPKLDSLARHSNVTLEYCVGNLRYREDAVRAVDGVQLIFHLAAGKKGSTADLFLDSAVASRNLLDAVADRKPMRIVLVSSFGVYGVAGLGRGAVVNEQTTLETHPEWRDHYSSAKLRQEQLFWEYRDRNGFDLVVLRPGVIYGPDGSHFSNRVGLTFGKVQLFFGGRNVLPLSYVDNCAEAIVVAGTHPEAAGQVYNVHDDDLPTCREYLRAYRKHVAKIRYIPVPYFGLRLISKAITNYNQRSKGQLPAILTPYKVASTWAGNRFDNSKLHSIGWKQLISTTEGLQRSFAAFRGSPRASGTAAEVPTVASANPGEPLNERAAHSKEFVIGAALGPNPNGNFEFLLKTFANLRNAVASARLVIFTPAGALGNNTNLAEVQCVPDDLRSGDALQKCDVLVSLQDGVPCLLLRAISLRVPIITSAVRIPEALRNRRDVIFIDHSDRNGLQEQLLRLSRQPKRAPSATDLEKNIAKHYSDTYLWPSHSLPGSDGGEVESNTPVPGGHRALIKQVLFSAVPAGQLLQHGDRHRTQIALTVDDGPDPVYTPQILDIFRDHGVKATFFVVGGAAEQYPELVMRMKREGHEVGNHSYSHPYFHRLSIKGAIQEINMTRWVLDRILGEKCRLFRPPHGKLSLRSLIPAWTAGQHVVMWNVDLKDYRASLGDVEAQLNRTSFCSGDIILYHGTNDAAIKALPRVIEAAMDKGRTAVTISELIR